jgi:hypothetical protein
MASTKRKGVPPGYLVERRVKYPKTGEGTALTVVSPAGVKFRSISLAWAEYTSQLPAATVLARGTWCLYRDAANVEHGVLVTGVHHDDGLPYYTIRLHDSERHTVRERLRLPPILGAAASPVANLRSALADTYQFLVKVHAEQGWTEIEAPPVFHLPLFGPPGDGMWCRLERATVQSRMHRGLRVYGEDCSDANLRDALADVPTLEEQIRRLMSIPAHTLYLTEHDENELLVETRVWLSGRSTTQSQLRGCQTIYDKLVAQTKGLAPYAARIFAEGWDDFPYLVDALRANRPDWRATFLESVGIRPDMYERLRALACTEMKDMEVEVEVEVEQSDDVGAF